MSEFVTRYNLFLFLLKYVDLSNVYTINLIQFGFWRSYWVLSFIKKPSGTPYHHIYLTCIQISS